MSGTHPFGPGDAATALAQPSQPFVDRTAETSGLYERFIEFVRLDIQNERKALNRRMVSVFFWCFAAPAVSTFVFILLIKFGLVPRRYGKYTDWIIVGFPVLFSLYVLSSDVLHELPQAYRRGGMYTPLGRALEEARWRHRVCAEIRSRFLASGSTREEQDARRQWPWLMHSFQADLANVQHRNRYLTALAGAVFFLLMKGLDVFDDTSLPLMGSRSYILGWFEASSSNASQFIGLGLFLVLFYLSGNQAYVSLARYLQCLGLVQLQLDQESRRDQG